MPWKETQVVEERVRFVQEHRSGRWAMTELCEAFGVSRKTGYKYLARYKEEGLRGLEDGSRAPLCHGRSIPAEVVKEILALKKKYPTWGAPKLHDWLVYNRGSQEWPSATTIHRYLDREGLVRRNKRRRKAVPSEEPLKHAQGPNDLWCADFKGWFRTKDGQRCDPFTVTDAFSRYSLCCHAVERPNFENVQRALKRTFQEYGLPCSFRTDNGAPFSSRSIGGLSRLAVWLVKLGVKIERTEPGCPQQNGRHERYHRTLKADTASPPAPTIRAQQRRFHRFSEVYNEERPHESLGGKPPGAVYVASQREYPRHLRDVEYPADYEARSVNHNGTVKLRGRCYFVSEVLVGERVGLYKQSNHRWLLRYGPLELGVIDTFSHKVIGHGRLRYSEDPM